jgi:hypothetical protein
MNILNCAADQDREKARAETAKLQAVVELCRAKKAANKTGETAPLIKCLSNQLTGPTASAAAVAVKARLDAAKASFAAAEAKAHAKLTVAALKSDPLADQSDSQLQFIAGHRSAPAEDAAAARAELQARGWTCHANGAFSRSTVKEPRR